MAGRLLSRIGAGIGAGSADMKQAGWAILAIAMGAVVSTWAWADGGLTGLDAKLRATGRIGAPPREPGGRIAAGLPDAGAPERTRDPRRALTRIEADEGAAEASARPPQSTAADDEELRRTDAAVADCRVEVARRRRLPPGKVAAGTEVVRFTIEKTGRVREAEALSAIHTDLEVAACAKRVLSDWTFAKRARDAEVVVERTYRFSPG
jgi:hypothetical protein